MLLSQTTASVAPLPSTASIVSSIASTVSSNPETNHTNALYRIRSTHPISIRPIVSAAATAVAAPRPVVTEPPEDYCLLHRACVTHPNDLRLIETVLWQDPSAIRRRINLPKASFKTSSIKKCQKYSLPVNIAAYNSANAKVLDVLVQADERVLGEPDGPCQEVTLHVAIKNYRCSLASIDMMLLAFPESAAVKDRYSNTPLHLACIYRPTELELLRHLILIHPEAENQRNYHGHTPLELVQRSSANLPDEILECFNNNDDSKTNEKEDDELLAKWIALESTNARTQHSGE